MCDQVTNVSPNTEDTTIENTSIEENASSDEEHANSSSGTLYV